MEILKFKESVLQTITIMANNTPVEIRMLHVDKKGTVSGYYDDYNRLTKDIQQFDGKNDIYITMNEISPEIVARSKNHLMAYAKHTTKDKEIISRRWLLVDLDPSRPAGISSTDAELEAAEIDEYLCSMDFPEPVYAMSGNGYHLLYSLNEENSESVTRLIQQFLKALDGKFSNEKVKVDTSTYNAARIVKLYGTTACNGVSEERMAKQPVEAKNTNNGKLKRKLPIINIRDFCETHGIEISHEKLLNTGGNCYVLNSCPWNPEHTDKGAYIIQYPNGKIVAGCHHDSCNGENWSTLLKKFPDVKYDTEPPKSKPLESKEGMSAAQILLDEIKQAGQAILPVAPQNILSKL